MVLHDPQTLGLAVGLKRLGATVIWRCHIGTDRPGGLSEAAWDFLWPYVQEQPDVAVFSRRASVPARLPLEAVRIIVPSIDPCSVKNADMSNDLAASILAYTGLVERPGELSQAPAFQRRRRYPPALAPPMRRAARRSGPEARSRPAGRARLPLGSHQGPDRGDARLRRAHAPTRPGSPDSRRTRRSHGHRRPRGAGSARRGAGSLAWRWLTSSAAG